MDIYVAFVLVSLQYTVRGPPAVTSKNSAFFPQTSFKYSLWFSA
jgi:hypothetical protein